MNMLNKTLVPDKLQGYLLQVKHMLYELISVDDRVVSVEKLDDVAVEIDGKVFAEQIKSVTSANNPLAERSAVFWKTLYNWCTYIENGSLPSDAILRFVVVANITINPGSIQEAFNKAHSDAEAQMALSYAKNVILGNIQGDASIDVYATLPDTYKDYIRYLFDDVRNDIVCNIIKAMEIEVHNNTYDEELLKRFNNQTIPTEYADILLTYMLGWVTQTVESFTKNNTPAFIAAKDFREALKAQIRALDIKTILHAVSEVPSNAEQGDEVERLDTYIKQLKMIDVDDTTLYEAASDFLRTKVDKIEWAKRGLVIDQSFIDYNDALYRAWMNRKKLMSLQFTADPIACGQAIYFSCREDSEHQKLQGIEVPPFFGSGSLQILANFPTNAPKIGWHPQYIELLKEGSV